MMLTHASTMRRWLVTLALAVVALPTTAAQAQQLRVDLAHRTVTTTTRALARTCLPRVAKLPSSVELDAGALTVTTPTRTFRHALGHRNGLFWVVNVDENVIVGFASRATTPSATADTIVAVNHRTGKVTWRRSIDSMFAAELVDHLVAVERAGNLDILDARTGQTLGTTPLRNQALQAVCRPDQGDLHLKTEGDLIAIDRTTGVVRWSQPTSSNGNPTVTPTAVLDAWVDRTRHRFGIVSYDPQTGQQLDRIDLGATGGWYDFEHVYIAPDGTNDVLVSAMFAVE
jgi:outer membrane protein assembly factor BamB